MGRHSKKQAIPATELFNFHFSTPAVSSEASVISRNGHHQNRRDKQQYDRTAQDRASARKRANAASFYLHSSPDHSFALTRRSNSKVQGGSTYTFSGCDSPVSWESVRIVKHFVPVEVGGDLACPICLSEFICPRVTKCGHSYCMACILHHVQSHIASNPNSDVRCPCCSLPLSVGDLRPVIIERKLPPKTQNSIRLRKLHRQKGCSAPYLPIPHEPRHCNPHTAPSQSDPDAAFCRFNYVDPFLFRSLLEENRLSLVQEMKFTAPNSTDYSFLKMSLDMVLNQEVRAVQEFQDELDLNEQFVSVSSGMYQKQLAELVYDQLEEGCSFFDDDQVAGPDSVVTPGGRERGESITSHISVDSPSSCNQSFKSDERSSLEARLKQVQPGSMYLEDSDAVHFYQADDGQLVFLNGFNMACLSLDFSKSRPIEGLKKPPLPDFVSGQILEIQNIYLTADIRKKSPFLQHLPLYSEISLVELDLGSIMSKESKKKFQAELAKRRKKRQNKAMAEKRADRDAKREEERLINERKARYRAMDPNDEFFQTATTSQDTPTALFTENDPVLGIGTNASVDAVTEKSYGAASHQSFSAACRHPADPLLLRSEESFPGLQRVTEPFPALSSTVRIVRETQYTQTDDPKAPSKQPSKNKASKGKKVLVFSTGGQRGHNY